MISCDCHVTCRSDLATVQEEYVMVCREKDKMLEELELRARERKDFEEKLKRVITAIAMHSSREQ